MEALRCSRCSLRQRRPPTCGVRSTRRPPPAAVAVHDWTGFYVGGHGGHAWTDKEWRLPAGAELVSYTANDLDLRRAGRLQLAGRVVGGRRRGAGELGRGPQGRHLDRPDPRAGVDRSQPPARPVRVPRTGTTIEHHGTVAAAPRLRRRPLADLRQRPAPPGCTRSTARSTPTCRASRCSRARATPAGAGCSASATNTPSWATGRPRSSSTISASAPSTSSWWACRASRAADARLRRVAGHRAGQARHQLPLRPVGRGRQTLTALALNSLLRHPEVLAPLPDLGFTRDRALLSAQVG